MSVRSCLAAGLVVGLVVPAVSAADLPAGDKHPLLRLNAGGPTSLVTALAFSPDGQTLYAAGLDKVVHVWTRDGESGRWEEGPAYRVPLGPGDSGMLNALALSADGNWLAAAGVGVFRERAGYRQPGMVLPAQVLDSAMRQDRGVIYVFNTHTRAVRVLRGHQGPVLGLAFAPPRDGADGPPPLASAARQWQDDANAHRGAVWLWDVARGSHRAWPGRLPDPATLSARRPGLVVWRPGRRADGLRVAFTWGDGQFRVWDVGGESWQERDVRFDFTLARLPGRDAVLTGGFHRFGGYLRLWDAPPGKEPRRQETLPEGLDRQTSHVPMAMTLASSRPGGPADLAAVVLQTRKGDRKQTRLHLLDLTPRRFGDVKADVFLWQADESWPTVAAAPGGRSLAVAGGRGHEVWVYSVKDLLADDRPEPERLSSVGATLRSVGFVRRDKALGLVLGERAKAVPGAAPRPLRDADLVFDFSRPGLTTGRGWDPDAPRRGGWEVEHRRDLDARKRERHTLEVLHDGRPVGRVALEPNQVVTDFALLPPRGPDGRGVLAVALHEAGEPFLWLYDAAAGRPFRQYTGHDGIIRGLAFSGDGRLLASAAEDQTVCVWSLTDLDQTLGKRGLVPGLAVKTGRGGVSVARVSEDSPAAGKLEPGDVVEGLVAPGGKEQRLASAAGLYAAVWERKPGDEVRLRVKGKGLVRLPVGQGIDERKPLLTLFLTEAERPADRDWLGWNPYGPYEASGPAAERHLGWHLNTGRAEAPTAFAGAAKYRDKYYRKGILAKLVAAGDIARVAREVPRELPPPKVALLVGPVVLDPARADARGQIPVQTADRTLLVAVHEFPRAQVAGVEWRLDGGAWRKFEPAAGSEWSAELPRGGWGRGVHRLGVRVHTTEGRRREFAEERLVRYQPPPPALATDLPRRQTVLKPAFRLSARVRSEAADPDLEVQIFLNRKLARRLTTREAKQALNEPLELRDEDNLIEIVAANRGALKGYEDRETARLALEVLYKPTRPQIVLEEVVPLAGDQAGRALAVRPGEAVRVSSPRVRVRGSLGAAENLTAATRDGKALAGFEPGEGKTFAVREEVRLKPGLQTLAFRAKTRNTEAVKELAVEYRPLLPRVVFLPASEELVFADEGKGSPEVVLRFQLTPRGPAAAGEEFRTAALVNGAELPAGQVTLDKKAGNLAVKFKPKARRSRVQIRLTNRWADPESSELVDVVYLRPPHGVAFIDPPARSREPVVDLTARVVSPLPLLPEAVEATVNGRRVRGVEVRREKGDAWRVLLKEVSLDEAKNSKNEVRLVVANEDGKSKAGACTVVYAGKPPRRPDVAILAPGNTSVTEPEVTVQFRVRSETPLKRLAVVNPEAPAGQALDVSRLAGAAELKASLRLVSREAARPLDVADLKADAEGFRAGELALRLVPGLNHLYVEAANEGGARQSAVVVVNYLPPPVRLVLDRLETGAGEGMPAEVQAGGRLAGKPATARLWLRGRVLWDKDKDERLGAVEWVRVRVNGLQQVPAVRLAEPDKDRPRERRFRVEVLLNRPRDNRLDLDLPGLEQEDGSRRVFFVDCAKPVKERRFLHLLVVGIGTKDGDALRDRVFKALRAKVVSRQVFRVPSFDEGRLYGPLVGNVEPDRVYYQLLLLKSQIDLLARGGPSSHIVLVYYQGGERVSARGHFLRTSAPRVDPDLGRYRIPCGEVEARLADTLGAKILLLDVQREPAAKPARDRDLVANWPRESYVAVMRYAQLGGPGRLDEAGLIRAWEEALDRANRLKAVEDQVARLSRQFRALLARQQVTLLFNGYIPRGLWDLVIGPQ